MSLENAKNEIYAKIGRNIMLFQQIEGCLKYITTHNKIAAHVSELQTNQEEIVKEVSNKTLGGLVSDHLGLENKKLSKEPDVSKEPFMSFHLELGETYCENKKKLLTDLVAERNKLVHHSYLEFDFKTIDSCTEISNALDEQRDRIESEINDMKKIVDHIASSRRQLADYLKSNMGKLFLLQDVELVKLLADIYIKTPKIDEWVSLNLAGRLLLEIDPEYKKKYNMKSLKKFIVCSDFFDIEEKSIKQNSEIFYRIKPGIIHDEKSDGLSYKVVSNTGLT